MKETIASLAWVLVTGCTSSRPEPKPTPEPEVPLVEERYDLSDFKNDVQDLPGPKDGAASPPLDGTGLAATLVRSLITRGHVDAKDGTILVQACEAEQRMAASMLVFLKERDQFRVSVRARFVSSERPLDGRAHLHSAVFPTPEAEALIPKKWIDSPLQPPRITCFQGQRSHILVCSQFTYIRDFEVRFDRSGKWTIDPQPDIALFGWFVGVRPVRIDPAGSVLLSDLRIVLSDGPQDPPNVDSLRTPYGTRECPNVEDQVFVLNPILRPGETLVVGPLSDPWGKRSNLWVLMEASIEPVPK